MLHTLFSQIIVISRTDLRFRCETSEVVLSHASWKNVAQLCARILLRWRPRANSALAEQGVEPNTPATFGVSSFLRNGFTGLNCQRSNAANGMLCWLVES